MEHKEDIRDNPCKQHLKLAEQFHSPYPHNGKKPILLYLQTSLRPWEMQKYISRSIWAADEKKVEPCWIHSIIAALGLCCFERWKVYKKSCKPISQNQTKEWNTSIPVWVCRRWVSFPTQNKTCPTTILPFVFTGNVPGDCQSQGLSKDVLSPSSPAVPDLCSSRLQSLPCSTTYIPQLVSVRGGFVTHCHGTSSKHQVLGSTLCSQPAEFNKESQPKFRKSHKCRFNSTHRTYLQEIGEINQWD